MLWKTGPSVSLLSGALQQRWHANLKGFFGGAPVVQLASGEPVLDLDRRGRVGEALRGERDYVHLGAACGAPCQGCFGTANQQECVRFYGDSGDSLHHDRSSVAYTALLQSAAYWGILHADTFRCL